MPATIVHVEAVLVQVAHRGVNTEWKLPSGDVLTPTVIAPVVIQYCLSAATHCPFAGPTVKSAACPDWALDH